jgi:hypothetical protein
MCNDYARMLQAFVPNFIRLFNVGCFQVFSCVFKCFQTYVAPVLAIFDPLAAVAKASSLTERRWFCIHVREKWKGKRSHMGVRCRCGHPYLDVTVLVTLYSIQ